MNGLLFLGLILGTPASYAVDNIIYQPTIHAHNQVEFIGYDVKSNTYHIIRDGVKADESELFAFPEKVAKGIHSLTVSSIRRNPQALVGRIYSTDEDLDLIDSRVIDGDPKFAALRELLTKQREILVQARARARAARKPASDPSK